MTATDNLTEDFAQAIDEAITARKLPKCCDENGAPYLHSDHFGGRARKFSCWCPEDHYFKVLVWAPEGKRWS